MNNPPPLRNMRQLELEEEMHRLVRALPQRFVKHAIFDIIGGATWGGSVNNCRILDMTRREDAVWLINKFSHMNRGNRNWSIRTLIYTMRKGVWLFLTQGVRGQEHLYHGQMTMDSKTLRSFCSLLRQKLKEQEQ